MEVECLEAVAQAWDRGLIRHHGHRGPELGNLGGQRLQISARRERDYAKTVFTALDDVEAVLTD
jgi:hypothetical protein